jgi:organic hydroperoxide reductase OsmC/OhrA
MATSPTRAALYTAKAHVTGGRAHGHGRTSDGMAADLICPYSNATRDNVEAGLTANGVAAN